MAVFKHFAVVGYGMMAGKIVTALSQKKAEGAIGSLVVLSRSDKAQDELASKGAELRVITEYADAASVETALRGIDVVVSTLNKEGIAAQPTVLRAAKAAGAQLFVPSDFGSSVDEHTEGVFGLKNSVKTIAREIGLPFASFYTGGFPDVVLSPNVAPAFGLDFANGQFTIADSGEAVNSYTATDDVARFVAHALTALPKDKLEWRVFRIEGERISWNDIVSGWAARTGRQAEVAHHPIAETEAKLSANPQDFVSFLIVTFDAGKGGVGATSEVSNGEWPEWKPKGVVDVIVEMYKQ